MNIVSKSLFALGMTRLTYALDDLEENDAQEGVDLCTLLVCATHLGLHPFGKSTRGFESTGHDQNAGNEEPQMSV